MMTIHAKTAFIGLGSNLGDRRSYLYHAVERLHQHDSIHVVQCSSIYETAPVGLMDQPHFLNMVVAVRTNLTADQLLEVMLETERGLGRIRDVRWGPRTIDLDLLVFEQTTMQTEQLELPHPRLHERAFVLIPLMELYERYDLQDEMISERLRKAFILVDGKDDVQLWEKTNWRSEFGRFEN